MNRIIISWLVIVVSLAPASPDDSPASADDSTYRADASATSADDPRISAARNYVSDQAIIKDDGIRAAIGEEQLGRDPNTSTTSFVFAIRRHAKQLLSPEQAVQWETLVSQRSPRQKQLHDDRNVLRSYFFACAWKIASLPMGEVRNTKQHELHAWLDVWMHIRQQEQIAHHQLCRDAWSILNDEQLRELQRGTWDEHVKKSTGHARNYFGDRIVRRALGDPTKADDFDALSERFSHGHLEIRNALLSAEARYRRATFTLPSLSDQAMIDAWAPVDEAYRDYFWSQAQHIIQLSHAGYDQQNAAHKERLLEQPARELANLNDKIEKKLVLGAKLRDLINTAESR